MRTNPDTTPGKYYQPGSIESRKNQQGGIAVMVALMLALMLAFAAFSVDFPYLFVVRSELQNAADAAALRGAACLYRNDGCDSSPRTVAPNFTSAKSRAEAAITLNGADTKMLVVADVTTGYWDLTQAYPGSIGTNTTPGTNDAAAVQVVVRKATDVNDGEVSMIFARLAQVYSIPVRATAVAVVPAPGSTAPNTLFPIAINDCLFNVPLWNTTTNQPILATSTTQPPEFNEASHPPLTQVIGEPYIFGISSAYHMSGCLIGQWTSFNLGTNDAATMKDLISRTETSRTESVTQQDIGDGTWIEPGTKSSLFTEVKQCSASGNKTCEWVFVPIVDDATDTHSAAPIKGFGCLHILDVGGSGANSYIIAQLGSAASNPQCILPSAGGGGPNLGLLGPPKLAR